MSNWATIGGINLDAPNSLNESNQILGSDTITLAGKRRRSIRALKKTWTISYSHLSAEKYDEIYTVFAAGNAVSFTILDSSYVSVSSVDVFINLEVREFVAGNPSYLANVTLTLIEQ